MSAHGDQARLFMPNHLLQQVADHRIFPVPQAELGETGLGRETVNRRPAALPPLSQLFRRDVGGFRWFGISLFKVVTHYIPAYGGKIFGRY